MAGQAILGDSALNHAETSDSELAFESLDSLVMQHTTMVFRICYSILRNHHDAEDASQECFLKLLKWRDRMDKVRNPRTWLARIAWTTALDRRSSRKLQPVSDERNEPILLTGLSDPGSSPEEQAASAEIQRLFERMVAALPEELRHPLELSTVEGLNSAEIGEILNIPESSVRTRLFRARTLLKEKVAAQLEVKRHG